MDNQSDEKLNQKDFQSNSFDKKILEEVDFSVLNTLKSPQSFSIINQTPAISAEDGGITPAEIQARNGQNQKKTNNIQQEDQIDQSTSQKDKIIKPDNSSQKMNSNNSLNLEIQSSAIRLNRKFVPVNKRKQSQKINDSSQKQLNQDIDQSRNPSPTDPQHTQEHTQVLRTESNTFDQDDMGFKINNKLYINQDYKKDQLDNSNLLKNQSRQNSNNILISQNKEQLSQDKIVNSIPFAYSDEQTKLNKSYVDRVLALGPIWNNTPNQFGNSQLRDQKGLSEGKSSVITTLHGRNQSQDDAKNMNLWQNQQNQSYSGIGLNKATRPSIDKSQISGATFGDQSPLIEEVRKNNYSKVSKLMEQFILGKNTSGTVTGRESQQRHRNIKNSFQTLQAQRKRSGFDKNSTQNTDNPDYPGAVGPKMQINVPRQLVLYQLSKNIDAAALENSMSQQIIAKSITRLRQPQTTQEKSFLDFLQDSVLGPDIRSQKSNLLIKQGENDHSQNEILQNLIQGIHSQSSVPKQKKGAPFAAKSFRTIDNNPNSFLSLMKDKSTNLPPDSTPFINGLADQSQQNSARNIQNKSYIDIQPSYTQNSRLGIGLAAGGPHSITQESLAPALTSFHLTDLLERSIIMGAKEREENKLRQIIEFYKRSVKTEKEMNCRKEIFIRNYRLHVVKDADKDVTDEERALLSLNKGTTIHVGNSIIKPEICKFGTDITDKIHQVYPFLLDQYNKSEYKFKNMQNAMKRGTSFHRTTYSQGFIDDNYNGNRRASLTKFDKELNEKGSSNLKEARKQQKEILKSLMEDYNNYNLQGEINMEQLNNEELFNIRNEDQISSEVLKTMTDQKQYDASQKQLDEVLSEIASSRPFTAAEFSDQEAVSGANKIFDRWLRNIFTQSSEMMAPPQRRRLTNGQVAAPGILDINWQIAIDHNIVLKQKSLGLDEMTVKSVYNQAPYKYLQLLVVNRDIKEWYSRFVLKTQAVRSYSKIAHEDLQSMNFADFKVAIDFQRHHLSHLDQIIFKDDNLPLELFLDFDVWIKDLAKACYQMKSINELRNENEKIGIPAETIYFQNDGSRKPINCEVMSYDPLKARFLVANKEMQIATWRSRLFILLESDSRPELENLRAEILQEKFRSLEYLRIHKLIQNELIKRFDYLRLSNNLLAKIQERLGINILLYNLDSVRKIIIQVEALYVFSILKSTINSQKNDPFIKGLLIKYCVPFDSPALSYFKTRHKEKIDLLGIEYFDIKAAKVELDQNSLLLMDEKYIKMPVFLNQVTSKTIGAHKLFRFPFDINLLQAQNVKEFRKIKKLDLHDNINTFPLQHNKFVLAQKAMSKYFHQIAKFRWAETIQKEIWSFVQDDFEFDIGKELQEDQIDPVLLRLFYQIKLYMQTVMFEYFEEALHDYLWFLLSFALRDEELKECKAIEEVKYNLYIHLRFKHKSQKLRYNKGELVNDVELIPLQMKPMIQIHLQIEDVDIAGKLFKKQKVFTKPDLESVTNDLFQVILNMHDAFKEVDRIDKLVFPLLILQDRYLIVPDVNNNEKLKEYVRITEKLIEQSLKQTRRELQNVNSYMNIFDKRLDNLILQLKKRSFELQQDISDGEGKGKKGDKLEGEDELIENEDGQKPPLGPDDEKKNEKVDANEKKKEEEEEESEEAENEEDDSDKDNQVNDMAYKSVEIDDGLLRDELFGLRALVWKILENIHNQYDYGIVYLDCIAFKDKIVGHIRFLIEHLESYVRIDFTNKQKSIWADIISVRGKLDMEVQSIDDVIMLLDYIDSLKKQDNTIGEISAKIDELSKRMDYIESVYIKFPGHQFAEFLEIRNWPRTFRQYIEDRKKELLDKKDDLYEEMNKEIQDVFAKIEHFKETIRDVLKQGLVDRALEYDQEDLASIGDSQGSGAPNPAEKTAEVEEELRAQRQAELEQADGKTFSWLAKEIKFDHMTFDQDLVEKVYQEIERLKQEFDEVERSTTLINKRETLLGVQKTQFSELKTIQDDLKPLYELWLVASRYGKTVPGWIEGKFEVLDAGQIEAKIDEWVGEMKRLQKTQLLVENEKQKELQKFIFDSLNHFKRYGPMLRTLRTKGLAPRHWKLIANKLEVAIDPQVLTLYRLIMLELHDEEKLKTIKQICEIATKEYTVQLALETLDKEMRAAEFEMSLQPDRETFVVLKLPDIVLMFEEFFLRASVLKTNPHINNFKEKLLEIEKIIKNVIELVNEWSLFQRNFVYLNSIFCLDEITKSLTLEYKMFTSIQQLYQQTTSGFQSSPQVFRIHFKENFSTVLVKANQDSDTIKVGLTEFLEKKRGKFPRLFFLSNEELIDIFGKGSGLIDSIIEDESKSFINNIFEGIDMVQFHPITQDITHIRSKEGEEVHLKKEVPTRQVQIDSWLTQLEKSMIFTVQDSVFHAFANQGEQEVQEWVEKWPGQAIFLASQIWFTFKVEAILAGATERERLLKLKSSLENNQEDSDEDQEEVPVTSNNLSQIQISPSSGQILGDQGESDYFIRKDPDEEDERIYQEQVIRQIQKDEVFCPERAQLEKILHLKQRFRINSKKSAGEQMEKVLRQIGQTILLFTEMVRKRLKNNIRASTVALITCQVNLRDIMDGLLRSKITRADEFKWLMQFKFVMKKMEEAVYKSAYDPSAGTNKLETNKIEVDCEVFGNNRAYGWEYLGNSPRLVVTPLTERCQRSLLVALQYNYGGAPEGPFGTGKTETTKDLSRQVAKLCFVLNCSANYEYTGICRFFKGLAASGAWVVFDEFNRMERSILSLISQVIISIQGALKQQQTHVTLEEQKVNLKPDCAIFITLNPGYAGRSELPINLKSLFRSVSMVVPDSTFITEILLYSAGFVGAQQLAQKIVRVQNLANVVMQKGEISHDFGLRSIKAIIGIAETLKLHAQDINESELTEIIDDQTLEVVGYKSEQIIMEIMAKVQAKFGQKSLQEGQQQNSTNKSATGKVINNNTGRFGVEELVKIEEQNEIDDDQIQVPQNQENSKGDYSKRNQEDALNTVMNLESIRSSVGSINMQIQDNGPARILTHEIANDMKQLKGELYDRVWNRIKFQERQRRTVFRQIGIDPDEEYTEEELEEFIILKAVRDFNHSKFAVEEHIIIEGAIKDVFQGSVPDIDKPIQDYTNLKEALHQSFQICKIDYAQNLKIKALQFYEILRSKHGCIIVGEPQSGKSTLIQLLQSALNKAAQNEFKLAVSEKRRERLILLAQEKESLIINDQISQNQLSSRTDKNEAIGAALKKKSKKGDKELAQKRVFQQWQEMYRTTKLSQEEIEQIRSTLTVKGVALRRLNPKGMTIDEMFGVFDKESHEWYEGAFTVFYREFASSRDDKKKWVLLDGPIDYMWVENLNSILDDNKRMSLPNGESIKMSEGMSILLETNHLKNVTPATVSRCGLIHLHRRETCNPKAIFNQWLRTLPPNLSEYLKDLELATNYLMSEAILVYEVEQKAGRIMWPQVDLHWLMQNFTRLFQTFIYDYFVDFEKTNTINMAAKNMNELGKSLMNLTLGNKWVDMLKDPNETFYTEEDTPNNEQIKPLEQSQEFSNEPKKPSSSSASRLGSRAQAQRVVTPNAIDREIEKKKRLPRNCFIESEMRYENALKFTAIWLEAFMVTSLVWTFQPVLSDQGKRALDHRLRVKYAAAKTDYSTYQREKKRKLAERNRERSQSNQKSMEKTRSIGRTSGLGNIFKNKQLISSEKSNSQSQNNQEGRSQMRSSMQNFDGYSAIWTDEFEEKPMLISDYPDNCSFYDYYFNLESSQWNKFSLELEISDATLAYNSQLPSQKAIRNFYIPTNESIRYQYLLECFVTNQSSTLIAGPSGSGRSCLMRQMLFTEVFKFTKQLQTEHITMSNHTSCVLFKENIEKLLEWRVSKITGNRRLRPHLDNKLICYVEDMHLGLVDQHGDQTSTEAIRDYLTQQQWLSSRKRAWREIEDLTFFGCLSINSPEQKNVSPRVLHLFNLIAIDIPSMKTIQHIIQNLTVTLVSNWPSSIQIYSRDISNALIDISVRICKHLRPTPMKAQYTFSWRDIYRILNSIEMAEENSLKKQEKVMKLFYHEVYRNYADRILMQHDLIWLKQNLEEVCRKHFYVVDELEDFSVHDQTAKKNERSVKIDKKFSHMSLDDKQSEQGKKLNEEIDPKRRDQFLWPIHDPDSLFFSSWNQEVEGYYMEVEKINEIEKVVASVLERHNDSNERTRIDLMLFNHLCRIMLKILRAISIPNGHLINVAMKGFGVNQVMKLVTFAAGHILRDIEVYDGYSLEEWHSDIRRAVAYCGNEGKPLTLYVDEYKLIEPQMYQDLACLIKNNVVSDIIRKNDIMLCLANIHQQTEAEKKATKFGLEANDIKNEKAEIQEERDRIEEEMKQDFIADNKKMMAKWPHIQAQCQKIFLNRVKKNFHLVIQFTPTGQNFRERISKQKDLLYNSQLIFITDLMHNQLCELGKGFFKLEHEKAVEKAIVDGTGIVKVNQYSLTNEKGAQDKVLNSIVKMFINAQDIAKRYSEDEGHILTFTPTVYLSVFKCYKKLLKERKEVVKDVSQRYDSGLLKIRNTQDKIYRYHQELEKRSPKLLDQQRQLMKVIAEYEAEFQRIKAQRDQLKRDEFDAELQTEQALKIKEQCEEALDKLIPALNEAMNQVTMLTKHDIAELRSMQKPPKAVKLVLQVVCMLLNVPPTEKRSRKTGKPKLSYWKAAQGPEVLGNPRFSEILVEFDRNKLTPEKMMEVEDVLQSSNYSYEKARSASVAATGIFKWVNATRDYFYVFKDIEPRRDAFMLSQKQYEEKKNQLEEKTVKISHLYTALGELKAHQKSKDDVIEELRQEIQDCSVRKKRADILLQSLSSEKQKWVVCTRMLSNKYSTVTGDVLISAGFISLLGGFNQNYRTKIIRRWQKILAEEGFPCSKEFIFSELFGDAFKIRKWHLNLLPEDTTSVNNALIIEKTKSFILLFDPQLQAITWLKKLHDSTLTILKQDDPNFKKNIEIAVESGRTVIIEGINSKVGMNLHSLIKKQISKYGGQSMIQFCRKSYKYDKNFRLFVVSQDQKPNLDVNVTNHVTLINFGVNEETLMTQMLGLVIFNERRDLGENLNENSKEAFDSIKSLKDIEEEILKLLDNDVIKILGEDSLIRVLNDSKNTAEFCASKLKNIAQTNQFIAKSREIYQPVALRATTLYFVVRDLHLINPLYQFSLAWFKKVFSTSMEMTNAFSDQHKTHDSDEDETVGDGAASILNNTFSIDDRIDLIIRAFTQELYKKLMIAVFDEDKQLITYTIVTRVLETENILDKSMYNFLIYGAQKLNSNAQVPQQIKNLPLLTNVMWAELQYLSRLRPFNAQNLLNHIIENQDEWSKIFNKQLEIFSFQDLPNVNDLDLKFFMFQLDEELITETKPLPVIENKNEFKSQIMGTDAASLAGRTVGDTNSRAGSRGFMKRSESGILNDPEIWEISDSDEEDLNTKGNQQRLKTAENQVSTLDQKLQLDENLDQKDDEEKLDQEDLARYLVERAPSISGRPGSQSTLSDGLRKKTTKERQFILKREKVMKGLCEMAILRCLRPDLLIENMNRFVLNVLDPNYFDFKEDIMAQLIAQKHKPKTIGNKNVFLGAGPAIGQKATNTLSKISIQNKSSTIQTNQSNTKLEKQQSVYLQTQNANNNSVNQFEQGASQSGEHTYQNSQGSAGALNKKMARDENVAQERLAQRIRRGGYNNIQQVIREAYQDSSCRAPILFLMSHSVNLLEILSEFTNRMEAGKNSSKLHHYPLGQGLEEMVEEKLTKAALNGDWILLENLHLVEDWLPVLDDKLAKWKDNEINSRFRLWIGCTPTTNFPPQFTERAIKVALQPPETIQKKIIKMIADQEKDNLIKKAGKQVGLHKNLFFALTYMHSILHGRKKYGTLGFNIPYKFDFSDFEVSNLQLIQALKSNNNDLSVTLDMLKYFYAQINYAGKVQRVEDQVILNAICDDLFSQEIIFSTEGLEPNPNQSHYGFPREHEDLNNFVDEFLPLYDNYQIYGFSFLTEAEQKKDKIFNILEQISSIFQNGNDLVNRSSNIEMNSLEITIRSSTGEQGPQIFRMLKEETSLLNLLNVMQKSLESSSLDHRVTNSVQRYDKNIAQESLPRRDENDQQVAKIAKILIKQIDSLFDIDLIQKNFPIMYMSPINNVINRELSAYRSLLKTIRGSVEDLLANIDGKYPREFDIEALWSKIQQNQVPEKWKKYSFATSKDSLADFIIELSLKLEFWRELLQTDDIEKFPSFWLRAFFDPKSFLISFMQKKSRIEHIPLKQVYNKYIVTDVFRNDAPISEKNIHYIHGLNIEGAEWDANEQILIETTLRKRFNLFPSIQIQTIKSDEELRGATPIERFANFSLNMDAKKSRKMKSQSPTKKNDSKNSTKTGKRGFSLGNTSRISPELGQNESKQEYRCPIFQTTNRLSKGIISSDQTPIEYVKLLTLEEPRKWVKRAVAIVLEAD